MAKVEAAKCKKCGKVLFPTHFYCPQCGAREFEPVPVEGEGTLLTWIRIYTLPLDYSVLYSTVGIVGLDMGVRAMGKLDIAEPATGMRVKTSVGVVRVTGEKPVHGLVFSPV